MVLVGKCLRYFAMLMLLSIVSLAQSRDAKALDVLRHSFGAIISDHSPSDIVLTAALSDGTEMRFKARSATQFRIEITSGSHVGYFLSSNGRAWASSNSSVQKLPAHTSLAVPSPLFLFQLIDAISNPATKVTYVGLEEISGTSLHHIRIRRTAPGLEGHNISPDLVPCNIYIDPATFLVSRIEDVMSSVRNANDTIRRQIVLSDYKSFSGLTLPSTIEESLGGNHLLHLELHSVAVDTGLSDTEFAPPSESIVSTNVQ